MKIIRSSDFTIKKWSGGTTTELYIFPENSSYPAANFSFRLSRATIEVDQSVFTKLENVKRALMLTKGKLKLIHKNKYNKTLSLFQSDEFSGNWHTESLGQAEDFNLMMMGTTEGHLESLNTKSAISKTIETDCDLIAITCIKGSVEISSNFLSEKEVAIIKKPSLNTELKIGIESDIIVVRIWLNV